MGEKLTRKDPVAMIQQATSKGVPTFTIKATDKHASIALTTYLREVIQDPDVAPQFKAAISEIFTEWMHWQVAHKYEVKSPD